MPRRPQRVLVADDHALLRRGLRLLFADHLPGAAVVDVAGFEEALAALAQGPAFDLAILDLDMPGMAGAASLRRLRSTWPQLRVVVLSASETREHVLAAIGAGAHGYLLKSMDNAEMVRALKQVLAGTIYVPGFMTDAPALGDAAATPAPTAAELTPRQRQVLQLLIDGKSNKEISSALGVAEGTVKMHLASLFRTLRVKNRAQAVARAAGLRL